MQQFAGELADVGRHGGGEEQVLPLPRQFAHDAADRPDEAEIEHLVDLVEDQEFDRAQSGDARVEMVEQTSRRRHQHVEALGQRPDLGAVRHAAEDDGDVERQAGREVAEALGDLAGEFARRAEHENARAAARRRLLVGDEAVENRQRERRRLAGAGLGDADQVAALHQDGNGLRLNRRRLGVAHLGQRGHERRGKAEAVEIFQEFVFQTAAKAREILRCGGVSLKGTPRVSGRSGDLQIGARQEDKTALHAAGAHRPLNQAVAGLSMMRCTMSRISRPRLRSKPRRPPYLQGPRREGGASRRRWRTTSAAVRACEESSKAANWARESGRSENVGQELDQPTKRRLTKDGSARDPTGHLSFSRRRGGAL